MDLTGGITLLIFLPLMDFIKIVSELAMISKLLASPIESRYSLMDVMTWLESILSSSSIGDKTNS